MEDKKKKTISVALEVDLYTAFLEYVKTYAQGNKSHALREAIDCLLKLSNKNCV